ncbi:MAG: SAF domain-containing protein [Actinobacteria bacterium]|nr:SAF domain-containing protein [Actinomycetota bacterium]
MTLRTQPVPATTPRSPLLMQRSQRMRRVDTRLLAGIALIILSIGLTSIAMGRAGHTTSVWIAARDVPSGVVVTKSDVSLVSANLSQSQSHYVLESQPVLGLRATHDLAKGEFIPGSALSPVKPTSLRLVTVPVEQFHAPAGLARGDLVDVYINSPNDSGLSGTAALVATRVSVHSVEDDGGTFGASAGSVGVVLELTRESVARVVSGTRSGSVDLVRVPMDQS